MPNWTKADIDGLVAGMERGTTRPDLIILEEGGYVHSPSVVRRALYLAAGLTAEGEPKPEKVRCWMSPDPDWPEYPDFFYSEPKDLVEGRIVIPGWFIPDGAE